MEKTSTSYFGKSREAIEKSLTQVEEVLCPICGIAPKPFAADYQGFQLCSCPRCGLEFLNPRPTYEKLREAVYNDTYFEGEDDLSESDVVMFQRQIGSYERLLSRKGKVLDIGCGTGKFMEFADEHGWDVYGTDIRLSPRAKSKNFTLWEGPLDEIDFGDERFDVIRFNQVLEHTQDPVATLKIAQHLLAPGGIVHISVPNIAGISPVLKSLQSRLRLKGNRWRHYAALHHMFYFSPATLQLCVERADLELLEWGTPQPHKSGQNRIVGWINELLFERSRLGSILDVYCRSNLSV